jgi:uncharacterized protein (TIGR02246 family)
MKRIRVIILAVVLGGSVSVWSTTTIAQRSTSRADEEAIKTVIAGITEAFNKHDAKAWTRFATAEAQLVTVRGESMNGVAAIEEGLTALFRGRNRTASLKILDMRVRLIRPDVAMAHVTNELIGAVSPDGQALPPQRELSLRVFVKDSGVWRIAAFHNTLLQP